MVTLGIAQRMLFCWLNVCSLVLLSSNGLTLKCRRKFSRRANKSLQLQQRTGFICFLRDLKSFSLLFEDRTIQGVQKQEFSRFLKAKKKNHDCGIFGANLLGAVKGSFISMHGVWELFSLVIIELKNYSL